MSKLVDQNLVCLSKWPLAEIELKGVSTFPHVPRLRGMPFIEGKYGVTDNASTGDRVTTTDTACKHLHPPDGYHTNSE